MQFPVRPVPKEAFLAMLIKEEFPAKAVLEMVFLVKTTLPEAQLVSKSSKTSQTPPSNQSKISHNKIKNNQIENNHNI